MVWLDSIIKNSYSTFSRPYKRSDFVTANYYTHKELNTVFQVMKDSSEHIRQITISKKKVRTFIAQYYSNGQLTASIPLDGFGQYQGAAFYYYENGATQNEGLYHHGLNAGT